MHVSRLIAYRLVCGSCCQQKGRGSGQDERELYIAGKSLNGKSGRILYDILSYAGEICDKSQRVSALYISTKSYFLPQSR